MEEFFDPSGWEPPSDYVVKDRDWFKDGLNNDHFVFGAVYLDAQTNSYILSASTKLNDKDGVKRVASCDVSLENIISKRMLYLPLFTMEETIPDFRKQWVCW